MNIENIRTTRRLIATCAPREFSIREYCSLDSNGCGTAACVGGWAYIAQYGMEALRKWRCDVRTGTPAYVVHNDARDFLGLSEEQAESLFLPSDFSLGKDNIGQYTQARAVAVLDHLMATGEVQWRLFGENGERL